MLAICPKRIEKAACRNRSRFQLHSVVGRRRLHAAQRSRPGSGHVGTGPGHAAVQGDGRQGPRRPAADVAVGAAALGQREAPTRINGAPSRVRAPLFVGRGGSPLDAGQRRASRIRVCEYGGSPPRRGLTTRLPESCVCEYGGSLLQTCSLWDPDLVQAREGDCRAQPLLPQANHTSCYCY